MREWPRGAIVERGWAVRELLRHGVRLHLVQGDITTIAVDAIVNAANSALSGGGGVDGAIHRAGGPTIMAECRRLGGCPTGEARITAAGNLAARFVIHTVGPIWRGGQAGEAALLAAAYRNSLELAKAHAVTSIAFPSISTGVYGYPIEDAARVALSTTVDVLKQPGTLADVTFVLFSDADLGVYEQALDAAAS
jgi:O-acetyl-ADP-ribose deacetylase (regulator of RNase III)